MSGGPGPGQSPDRAARLVLSSYHEFYDHWMPRVKRFLMSQTSDRRWVEDVAQEAMLAARQKWDEIITYDKPAAWLFKVALTMLRRWQSKAREQCTSLDDMITRDPRSHPVTDGFDDWANEHLDLMAAIQALPRRQREVVTLHYIEGFPLAEAAEIMSITEGSAKTHVHRARKRLEQLLGPARPAATVRAEGLT